MAWDSESKADVIFRGRHNGIRRELPQCAGKRGMLKDLHKDARYLVDTYFFFKILWQMLYVLLKISRNIRKKCPTFMHVKKS